MPTVLFVRFKEVLASLNLFDSESKDPSIEQVERLSTRIYIVLLSITFIILLTYTTIVEQTSTITVKSPTQKHIEHLFDQYPESIHCPCTNVAIPYDTFTQMDVIYHQICSSPFVSSDWITSSYLANTSFIWPRDIRTLASTHAQMLALFCSMSQEQIDVALSIFKLSALITATVIEPSLLSARVENQFSVINQTVAEQLKTKRSGLIVVMRGNQLASGLQTSSVWKLKQVNDNTLTVSSLTIWYQYDYLEGEFGCFCDTITFCYVQAYFYPDVSYYPIADYGRVTYEGTTDPIPIDGWLANCYPIQSFLETNLQCYYNATCVNLLVDSSRTQTVPILEMKQNETRFDPPDEATFLTLINHLFVERIFQMISFENFLQQCAPQFCTYTLTHRAGFFEIISTILGLFGGMSAALRIFVSQIILRLLRWKYQRSLKHNQQKIDIANDSAQTQKSIGNKIRDLLRMICSQLVQLNLFSRSTIIGRDKIERQRWTTRLFLLSLAIIFLILTVYMSIEEQQKIVIVYSPNQNDYEILLHSKPSMRCLCTRISIEYGTFLNISPTFHQICSSGFNNWNFYQWLYTDMDTIELDFRRSAIAYFALLEHLCTQMRITVKEAYVHFSQKLYINDVLLTPELFHLEAGTLINTLIEGTTDEFALIIETAQRLTIASQFITQYQTGDSNVVTSDLQVFLIQNDFHRDRLFSNESCFCGRNLTCQRPAAFYDSDTHALIDTIPGLVTACLPFSSLLASNFACFYDETCVNRILAWFDHPNDTYGIENRIYKPILNSTVKSRFNQTSTVNEILSNIFVEEWNALYSYAAFFNQCNVSYCSYAINQRNNIVIIGTKLIGLFGGLNVALQLLLPFLVSLLDYFRNKISSGNDRDNQHIEHDRTSAFDHMKMKISTMNLFAKKNDDHLVDLEKINEQQIFTRVYIGLLFLILSLFIIYYAFIVQVTVTVTMNKPSIEEFEQAKHSHSDTLRCPSSRIAIDYQSFARIVHTTHQICSSEFISTDFTDFLYDLTRNPMDLSAKDFRMQAVYMFHVLRELCSLSQSLLNATIDQFMRTQLIATEMLSRQRFEAEIHKKFDALLFSISAAFRLNLNIFRTFVQGNQLQTTSASNWRFHILDESDWSNVQTLPITYNQKNCSCATSYRCFEPAKIFRGENIIFDLVGIQVGCTPLEALLASTFILFFNQTFVNELIDVLTDQNDKMQKMAFLPLKALNNSMPSRFKDTEIIEKVINESFIELWNISANYSDYYHENQPYQCVYTYVTHNDALFITSTVLGLYGGLTVTLHFIVPHLITLIIRIKTLFCKQTIAINAVVPFT